MHRLMAWSLSLNSEREPKAEQANCKRKHEGAGRPPVACRPAAISATRTRPNAILTADRWYLVTMAVSC